MRRPALLAVVLALAGPAMARAAGPPQVDATWVAGVSATSATLHAEVDPEAQRTTYRFEYETEAAWLANGEGFAGAARAPASGEAGLGEEEADQPALQRIERLTPATPYRYRIVATNASSPSGGTAGPAHTFATEPLGSATEECPNAQLRYEDGSFGLPDCRAYELVSPAEKNGGAVAGPGQLFGGGVLQAAAGGGAATFGSTSSFGDGAKGAPPASQYVSRRGPDGWSTENITEPTVSGAYGEDPDGVPYQLFSGDLARALLLNGRRCGEGEACPRSFSLRESESGALAPLPEAAAGMRLIAASPDLRRLLFEGEGHDYEWSGGALVPVSPPPADPGVLGTSADGSVVYYQDASGLFLSREGAVTEIAPGAEAAQPSDYPAATGTARVSADGTRLVFLSREPLTGYDNTDQGTGEPDTEVYLYEAGGGGTLRCASCNPTGERPAGPSSIPGAVANGTGEGATDLYKPRVLSADGRRLFFDSRDRIAPTDASAAPDVYEWEAPAAGPAQARCTASSPSYGPLSGGCLALISGGRSSEASTFVDASESGSDAFFLTADSLLATDPGAADLYDARVEGGYPVPEAPIPCEGDACQALPSPPEDPAPGTLVPGAGDPPARFAKPRCPKGKRGGHARKQPLRPQGPPPREAPWGKETPPPSRQTRRPPMRSANELQGRSQSQCRRPRIRQLSWAMAGIRVRQRAACTPRALRRRPRPGPRSECGSAPLETIAGATKAIDPAGSAQGKIPSRCDVRPPS